MLSVVLGNFGLDDAHFVAQFGALDDSSPDPRYPTYLIEGKPTFTEEAKIQASDVDWFWYCTLKCSPLFVYRLSLGRRILQSQRWQLQSSCAHCLVSSCHTSILACTSWTLFLWGTCHLAMLAKSLILSPMRHVQTKCSSSTVSCVNRSRAKRTDRQVDRQTDGQTDRKTDRQTDRQMDRHWYRQ